MDTMSNGASTSNGETEARTRRRLGTMADGVVGVMENARDAAGGVAGNVANQLPAAADATRQIVAQANSQMRSSSDEVLMVGSALAFGTTLGLFMAGTNRLAVAMSLIPAVALGATLLDRRTRAGGSRS